jgi:pectinesterase inhibitor-like protein
MKVTTMASSSAFYTSHVIVIVFLSALLLSATHHYTSHAQADGIDPLLPLCKSIGGGSRDFGIDFCISALGSDNRSRDAGPNFPVIAIDLLAANATSTGAKIGGLLKTAGGHGGGGDEVTRDALESCQPLYGGIVGLLPGCTALVDDGKFDRTALTLERTASAAKECEDAFTQKKLASPLVVEDDAAFKLAKLAVSLLEFLS